MADQLIKDLTALTDGQVNDDTKLVAMAVNTTGVAYKGTVAQLKKAFSTYKVKYVATGAEGVTLTISALAAKEILMIAREGQVMYEVSATPDSVEFIWNSTDITLGLAANPNERFLILYKNA